MMQRLKLFLPLGIFLLLALLLYGALGKDPQFLPSELVGQQIPEFQLPTLEQPQTVIGRASLHSEVGLLNVWASWCYACRVEHPFLTSLAEEQGIPLYGLNYKNDSTKAKAWLQEFGNPYTFSLYDRDGRLGIDLGVAGAPETFVFDRQGIIHHRHIGIVNEKVWRETLQPLVERLRGAG